jgi:hypothetical protein
MLVKEEKKEKKEKKEKEGVTTFFNQTTYIEKPRIFYKYNIADNIIIIITNKRKKQQNKKKQNGLCVATRSMGD